MAPRATEGTIGMAEVETAASPTPAERRRGLAAAIASVAVFGIGIGFATPLFSLVLEARGTETSLTGLNAAAGCIGVILGPMSTPLLVRRLGIRRFLLGCLGLDIGFFLAMKVFDSIEAWFVLRLALGFAGSSIFTATEGWINLLASDAKRGRIIGLYAAALAAGFGLGPLLLALSGTAGWAPFLVGAAVSALAAAPLLGLGDGGSGLGRERPGSTFAILRKAPFILLAIGLFGVFESAAWSLLPIWGVRIGLDEATAAMSLTAVALGSIALQVPIGWLSDKLPRLIVLRLCGGAGLLGALLLPLLAGDLPPLFAALLLWGGLAGGIYPVALAMAGERFRGAEAISANAVIIIAYGVGALLGPAVLGGAMDLWNPHGLLAGLAALFAIFLAATAGQGSRRADADCL
jgi:MFS family permease